MSYLEQFIQKLSTVPNDANRYLRLIRDLDKRVENIQSTLVNQQKEFLQKMRVMKENKQDVDTPEMRKQLESIQKKEKLIIGYSQEKVLIAKQLHEQIFEHSEKLKDELNVKARDKTEEEKDLGLKKKKLKFDSKVFPLKDQWYYDNNQPKYCYCGKGSSGEMVLCENNFCEKQWFHIDCIQEKGEKLPEKWYCAECRKLKEKMRHPISKSYI